MDMEQIETFIQKEQNRLQAQINRITNTHLPVSSFDITSFKRTWKDAESPYLQHQALSNLLYSLKKIRGNDKYLFLQEFYAWKQQICLEKNVTNAQLFKNQWLFFNNSTLTQLHHLITNIPDTCTTQLIEDGFISVEINKTII